ncbi:hypothetical protein LZ31DRAFT_327154 [Colletotrichum somersetense]|nr:hypothetical protein LZ31DRAFT_327154 [Colletotrichum somersetense]
MSEPSAEHTLARERSGVIGHAKTGISGLAFSFESRMTRRPADPPRRNTVPGHENKIWRFHPTLEQMRMLIGADCKSCRCLGADKTSRSPLTVAATSKRVISSPQLRAEQLGVVITSSEIRPCDPIPHVHRRGRGLWLTAHQDPHRCSNPRLAIKQATRISSLAPAICA